MLHLRMFRYRVGMVGKLHDTVWGLGLRDGSSDEVETSESDSGDNSETLVDGLGAEGKDS